MAKHTERFEIPEIINYLKYTRNIINQMKLFKKIQVPQREQNVINNAAKELFEAAEDYLGKEGG